MTAKKFWRYVEARRESEIHAKKLSMDVEVYNSEIVPGDHYAYWILRVKRGKGYLTLQEDGYFKRQGMVGIKGADLTQLGAPKREEVSYDWLCLGCGTRFREEDDLVMTAGEYLHRVGGSDDTCGPVLPDKVARAQKGRVRCVACDATILNSPSQPTLNITIGTNDPSGESKSDTYVHKYLVCKKCLEWLRSGLLSRGLVGGVLSKLVDRYPTDSIQLEESVVE